MKTILVFTFFFTYQSFAITANQIIKYAKTASGSHYVLGDSRWNPIKKNWQDEDLALNKTNYGNKVGVDCAGLVLKSWEFTGKLAPVKPLPWEPDTIYRKLHTSEMKSGKVKITQKSSGKSQYKNLPWINSRSTNLKSSQKGDQLTMYQSGAVTGHTLLFEGFDKAGNVKAIEARSTSYGVGSFTRTLSALKAVGYIRYRHHELGKTDSTKSVKSKTKVEKKKYHLVKKDETLSEIATKYATSVTHIKKLNPKLGKSKKFKKGLFLRVN